MRSTTWLRIATAAIGSTFFLVSVPTAPLAGELDDLRQTLKRQGELIETLQGEVGDLKRGKDDSKNGGTAQKTGTSADIDDTLNTTDTTDTGGGLTSKDVDQRIQDFETAPASRFMVSGYGTVEYIATENDGDGFGVSFNPGFHYRMSNRLHFNGELELELGRNGSGSTESDVGLEFAQIDFLLNDWMVVSGGYMLTPFNAFGQRLHPNWINKLASRPVIYGGAGIIPVIKQVGVMASGGAPMWRDAKFSYAFYAVNSPNLQGIPLDSTQALDIDFASTPNLSSQIAGGGRVGFLPIPNLEIGGSFQTGKLDNASDTGTDGKRFTLLGADLWYRWRDLEIRGEYVRLDRGSSRGTSNGYYIQAAYRLGSLFPTSESLWGLLGRVEPVIRWSQIGSFDPKEREQLAVGVIFWVYESAPLKFTYERNTGVVKNDRFMAQFAYGF